MITKSELLQLKGELESSAKPMIFFDDDADGLSSFLLYYRFAKQYSTDIKGFVVKSTPELKDEMFLRKIEEFGPDKVFVLDKPLIAQDFLDKIHKKTIWLDHHPPVKRHNVTYYNPLLHKSKRFNPDNRPTTYWAYKTVEKGRESDLWIAMVGCVSDWFVPEFSKEFSKRYPDLLPAKTKIRNPGTLLFETPLGKLCRIFQFSLKGNPKDVMSCIKILTRISDPYDILHQKTSQGRFIYKHYEQVNKIYEDIKSKVVVTSDRLILFEYEDKHSLTGDLANEIQYHNPDKLIIIARLKDGEMKCSLRSEQLHVRNILEAALNGVQGYGGGHEHACGACIKQESFKHFIENIRKQLTPAGI